MTDLSQGVHVVIAAYDEAEAVGDVVRGLRAAGLRRVVVVDDGSTDRTADEALAAGATVARHPVNRGQGAALATGIRQALADGARVLVTFDADGQHRPEDARALAAPVLAGEADVAFGSRFLGDASTIPLRRRLLLRAAVRVMRLCSGVPLTDAHVGLRALSAGAARAIDLRSDRMAHASEIVDRVRSLRLRWTELPVHVRYTDYSRRKGQSGLDAFRVAVDYLLSKVLT